MSAFTAIATTISTSIGPSCAGMPSEARNCATCRAGSGWPALSPATDTSMASSEDRPTPSSTPASSSESSVNTLRAG
jgi:hypothetical protein